jgi:ubiquitin-protein ligase E3 C
MQPASLRYSEYLALVQTWTAWLNRDAQSHITTSLGQWTHHFSTDTTLPVLAAALFSSTTFSGAEEYHYGTLLTCLVHTLLSDMETTESADVQTMLQPDGVQITVLSNALSLYQSLRVTRAVDPEPILLLLEYILTLQKDFAWILALHIKGELRLRLPPGANAAGDNGSLQRDTYTSSSHDSNRLHSFNDDDDDDSSSDDDSDTDHMDVSTTTTAPSRQQQPVRLTHRQLQTIPKLDRLYQVQVTQQRKTLLPITNINDDDVLWDVMERLTQPSLWLSMVQQAPSSGDDTIHVLVRVMYRLLQGCSGYKKTVPTSAFLSPLAQDASLLLKLWNHVLLVVPNSQEQDMAVTVFCNVFWYSIASLSDALFLKQYSTTVEQIIVTLRPVLYDLYWQRPVVVGDVDRIRTLLSASKLWNALYERWCRVGRVFGQDSNWWFPRLITKDNDADVVMPHGAGDDGSWAEMFRDPKMARLLTCIPQALPFDRRVKLFHALVKADKADTQNEVAAFQRAILDGDLTALRGSERVEIRRDQLYDDSIGALNPLGRRLRGKVQVTFINQHGAQEAGIDGGGVFKEFLDDLIKEAFDPNKETKLLFTITPLQTLAVNMETADQKDILQHYEFLGRVLGKAVYESILVEPQFCLPFLNQLLGKQNALEDLKNLDDEFYANLMKLRSMSATDIENLGLTFELQLGPSRTIPLMPGGDSMPVTQQNVVHYVHLVAHYRLNVVAAPQTRAFLRGFRDLIPASWVRIFSAHELQKLVSGDDTVRGIDVKSLQQAMQYAGGYHPSQQLMQWFWEVIDELTPNQQRQFLKFMTSCSRQPLLGFSSLAPAPCIQQIRLPEDMFDDVSRAEKMTPLPSSATCMNLLKLPNYRSKELLRKKLIDSIESGAGFELT